MVHARLGSGVRRSTLILALCGRAMGVVLMASIPLSSPAPALAQANEAAQASLPVQRITLYRSGVASMERRGSVVGDAQVQLTFQAEQINDILKSMIVLDLGGGSVRSVEYASQEGLARRLASFGIDISDKPDMPTLLDRLRGTDIEIAGPSGDATGTILGIERRRTVFDGKADSPTSVHELPWVTLRTASGLQSVCISTSYRFRILDEKLDKELGLALAAIAEARNEQRKGVTLTFEGRGERPVLAAYVQEAPVWKTSYRLALPDAADGGEGKPVLQGWAIVENTSDEDWKDVRLSLASGQPSAFRMNLYEPLYTQRPEIGVPVPVQTVARAFADGIELRSRQMARFEPASPAPTAVQAMKSPGSTARARSGGGGQSPFNSAGAEIAAMEAPAFDLAGSMGSAGASAMQTGEAFFFEVSQPVTIERKRSAMLPIVSQEIEGERVSILPADQSSGHPLRGVRVRSMPGMQLVAGPVAVYDANVYAGDAQMNDLGQSQSALLAYATDTDVKALREQEQQSLRRSYRVSKGVLTVSQTWRLLSKTTIDNTDPDRARSMIIEVRKEPNATISGDVKPIEDVGDVLRFALAAPKAGKATLEVAQERTDRFTVGLLDTDADGLAYFLQDQQPSQRMLDAFARIEQLRGVVREHERTIATLEQERAAISQEQDRIRKNLGSLQRTDELAQRLVRKLGEQETRLESMEGELREARAARDRAQGELEAFIANLDVE